MLIFNFINATMKHIDSKYVIDMVSFTTVFLESLVMATLTTGLVMISLRYIVGQEAKARHLFRYCAWQYVRYFILLALLNWLVNSLLFAGAHLLKAHIGSTILLLAIYLVLLLIGLSVTITVNFAVLLVAEKQMNSAVALQFALKAVKARFAKLWLMYIVNFLLVGISFLPVVIGVMVAIVIASQNGGQFSFAIPVLDKLVLVFLGILALNVIWVLPWINNVQANLYRVVFGKSN
jgi:hypothetical protein